MADPLILFSYLLFATAAVSGVFTGIAWRHRAEPGGYALTIYNAAIALGALTYGLDILALDPLVKYRWAGIGLVAMAVTGAAWVAFAAAYTDRPHWLTRRTKLLLALEPAIITVVFLLPTDWGLLYTLPDTRAQGSMIAAGASAGPVLVAHFLFIVVAMLVATSLLLQLALRARLLSRSQSTFLLTAAFAPWAGVLVRSTGLVGNLDVSIVVWALSGVAMTFALSNVRVLDPVPAGHATVVEEMSDGVLVLDQDDHIGYLNAAARDLLCAGEEDGSVLGDDIESVLDDWATLRESGHWQEREHTTGGTTQYMEVQASAFTDHLERGMGSLVLLRDITDRKVREQTLARYKTVFESVREMVYVADTEDRFVMANDPLATFLGFESSELVGRPVDSVLVDISSTSTSPTSPDPIEVSVVTADGENVPCEVHLAPVSFSNDMDGSVGVVHDVSDRKRVEADLAETSDRLHALVEASPVAVVGADTDGTVEFWNPAAEEMFGWSASEVVGDPIPIIPESAYPEVRANHQRVMDGETLVGLDVPLLRADGTLLENITSVAPVRDGEGAITGSVSVIVDITDRKQYQRELERQNERLEEFASVVSHDLRNPLNVADGYLTLLAEDVPDDRIPKIQNAMDRMETLIEDLLTLAREGLTIGDTEPVGLHELLTRAWASVDTVDATLVVDESIPDVIECDAGRVVELLENLFRNAVEHAGPTSTVTVAGTPTGRGFSVSDDGPGIDIADFEMVVTPGHSTKEDGTGFGLAIVERIAEAHDWQFSLGSSSDGGTSFEFEGIELGEPLS